MLPRPLALLLAVLALAGGCSSPDRDASPAERADAEATISTDAEVRRLDVEVVARFPHDPGAYTQGLLVDDGVFIEGTGQYGESDVREVEIESGLTKREIALPDDHFGEGLTLVDDRIIQLTWQEGVARVYDRDSFELVDEHRYEGEGWGLCLDDDRLIMSDGSSTLTFRDPDTFETIGSVEVTADGEPTEFLNELECVDGEVYANVYRTDEIVVVDPDSGAVTASIDASGLLGDEGDGNEGDDQVARAEVLNGIAHDPETGVFYLTGKYWPYVFGVRFVEAGAGR